MKFSEQVKLAKSTKEIHSTWYRETYPEVAELGIDPATHYVRYGAEMGRNPGKNFNTQFYLDTYPEVRESKLNPLVHYALHGQKAGYATRPQRQNPRKQINVIRTKLLSLGFTERPLAELTDIANTSDNPEARAMAARELALWHMRAKTEADYRTALDWIERAHPDVPDTEFRAKLATIEMLCHYHLNDLAEGLAAYDKAALAGAATPDLTLARVNFERSPENRVLWINQVLTRYDIEPITLLPDEGQPAYDRLTCAVDLPKVTDGPKVTVLIAAYDAAEMLPTALRSLQEQTWQNLEIIVLDDCSPTPDTVRVAEEFAAHDPRIQVVQMEQNGGAYVARNRGLDLATGELVTLHDADDWSHPKKIETQVRFVMENPDVMGCMSEQARMRDNLCFTRWTGDGRYLINNVSSLMWRKAPVRDALGYWDTVRFAADSEFIRRIQCVFGRDAVVELRTGPYSFQRDGDTSIVADEVMGMNGFYFGARREYYYAQRHYHKSGHSLWYNSDKYNRPFPIPDLMSPERKRLSDNKYLLDFIIADDFREAGSKVDEIIAEVRRLKKLEKRVGLVEMFNYDLETKGINSIVPELRDEIDGEKLQVLVFGDDVKCINCITSAKSRFEISRYIPKYRKLKEV